MDGGRGHRPGLCPGQRAPGVREPHRRGPGGHLPLRPATLGGRGRFRRLGWPPAHSRRDPGEEAGPVHLPGAGPPGASTPACSSRARRRTGSPEAAARARPSGSALFSVDRRAHSRLCHQAPGAAVPAGGAIHRRRRRVPPRAAPARRRAASGRHLTVRVRPGGGTFGPGARACHWGQRGRCRLHWRKYPAGPGPGAAASAPGAEPLRLTAFRNPDGVLPDGLALAPWERPSEVPPEKDGFFLLEALAPAGARPQAPAAAARAPPAGASQALAILFDTVPGPPLGRPGDGLRPPGAGAAALGREDRFALIPYDRTPAARRGSAPPRPRTSKPNSRPCATAPLGPGADLARPWAARKLVGEHGRILVLTSGQGSPAPRPCVESAAALPLFTAVTVGEAGEALRAASAAVLSNTATELEGDLFFQRLLGPGRRARCHRGQDSGKPHPLHGYRRRPQAAATSTRCWCSPWSQAASPPGWAATRRPSPACAFQLASPLFPGGHAQRARRPAGASPGGPGPAPALGPGPGGRPAGADRGRGRAPRVDRTRSSPSPSATSSSPRTPRSWRRPGPCSGPGASSPATRCCGWSATPARWRPPPCSPSA